MIRLLTKKLLNPKIPSWTFRWNHFGPNIYKSRIFHIKDETVHFLKQIKKCYCTASTISINEYKTFKCNLWDLKYCTNVSHEHIILCRFLPFTKHFFNVFKKYRRKYTSKLEQLLPTTALNPFAQTNCFFCNVYSLFCTRVFSSFIKQLPLK